MATKVGIISQAFNLLGRESVTDIDPSSATKEVIAAATIYETLLANAYASHPWRFAVLTRDLNVVASSPPFDEFTTVFQLPADYINLWRTRPLTNYKLYEDKIYANENELQIDYLADVGEENFPAWFTLHMVYNLAANVAMLVTQSVPIRQIWEEQSRKQLGVARYEDSQQQPSEFIRNDAIIASHFGGVGVGRVR